jgi:dTDP-4-dehydrorhamnose reductase
MFLVVGSAGQLGNELRLRLGDQAEYVDVNELNITDEKAVKAFVIKEKYEAIINCAAYTAVDKAEEDKVMARAINVHGPKSLALTGVPLVHISTDYVFDGTAHIPYVETDKVNPQTVYGITKQKGEKAVMLNADTAVIIRTSWLYSEFGCNFVKTMQKLGAEKDSLSIIFDQIGTPTYAGDLAQAIMDILPRMKKGEKEIYHFSNEGVCSWYDFAKAIMDMSGIECEVNPIETKDYSSKTPRPHYSVLNKSKIKKDFGIKIRHWRDALQDCIKNMKENMI